MNLSNCEPVNHNGNTNEWFTPKWILKECGEFDLDPCGDVRWPTANACYTKHGLEQDWFGRVWLKPPNGREIGRWLNRLADHGNGLALTFARTDTKWFQSFAPKCAWILFISGRIKFVESENLTESKRNPGAPSILMAVGPQPKVNIPGILVKLTGDR